MPDLVAQGGRHHQRWRRRLFAGEPRSIGRSDADWTVPWDSQISRHHADVVWNGQRLEVRKTATATNPIFFSGNPIAEFNASVNDHFVIGETTFSLTNEQANVSLNVPRPVAEQTFSAEYLKSASFRNAEQQILALSRLPDLIAGAQSDQELFVRLVSLLLSGIPKATAVAVVNCDDDQVELLYWDRSRIDNRSFSPSEQLIKHAIKHEQSTVHVWSPTDETGSAFTQTDGLDWAFCSPFRSGSSQGWAIYVAGEAAAATGTKRTTNPNDLRDDLKFAEIVTATVGNIREVRSLQKQQTALSRFFSPSVMAAVAKGDAESVLAPRETDVCVLFCDLRGFSRQSEKSAGDLKGLLDRVSQYMGIMTNQILAERGVIGDFHGDAAMGFWGWPIVQPEMIQQACAAALAIRNEFSRLGASRSTAAANPDDASPDTLHRVGIGMATGRAVAGRIGTSDQEKVTAFGPVVNTASRLEGLNSMLGTEILADETVANTISASQLAGSLQVRRIAKIRPYGMSASHGVYQIMSRDDLPTAALLTYEKSLAEFERGNWEAAKESLSRTVNDGPSAFLLKYINHNLQPPKNWDGIIAFTAK